MFLKSLEMVGFKSFADRTIIEFHKGMTAIVGPNGCGKSNVLDSIRWVLGETSAKALRGGSMQDVIFSGSDNRKSTGLAEVSLTFSECEKELGTDFHEVRITRRVYRDGQGEYEINKTPCRLKDIQQLFMDTGIGRTAYSIMEQGKIDAILSSKPEDRREVFEEAAGITRFKSQRKEAMRKLELTESNLLRVTDVIKEVNRQIGSLQRQAAKARRYKESAERLRELDTRLAAHQYKKLHATVQEAEAKVSALQLELEGLQKTIDEQEGLLRQKRIDLENIEDRIRNAQQKKNQHESDKNRGQQEIQFNQQRIVELEELIGRNRLDIASTEEKIRFQAEQVQGLQRDLEGVTRESETLKIDLQSQQQGWQEKRDAASSCLRERQAIEGEMASNTRKVEADRSQLVTIEAQQRSHILRLEKLADDEKNWGQHNQELQAAVEAARGKVAQCEQNFQNVQTTLQTEQQNVEAARAELKTNREELQRVESEKARLDVRHQALAQLISSRAGFSEVTRGILDRYRDQGVKGTLLEYLQVREGYERAMERCLGVAGEAVLLDRMDLADQLASDLSGKGAVIFAAPSSIHAPSFAPRHRVEAAIHFVTADTSVANWVGSLLNNCYIVEDAAAARALKNEMPGAIIVDRSGQVWHSAGWELRGQADSASQSILARKNELQKIEQDIAVLVEKVRVSSEAVEASRQKLDASQARLSEVQDARQKAQSEFSAARYDIELHEKRLKEWTVKFESIQHEKNYLAQQDTSGIEQQKRLTEEIESKSVRNRELAAKLDELTGRSAELTRVAEEMSQKVMDLRVAAASAEQRREGIKRQEESTQIRLKELNENLNIRKNEIEEYSKRIEQSRQHISQCEEIIRIADEDISKVAAEIDIHTAERQKAQQELNGAEDIIREERRKAMEMQNVRGREEVILAENKLHLGSLVERVQRAYQIQIDAFDPSTLPSSELPNIEGEPNWAEIEAEVAVIREKLDGMGPVNLEAIMEFEELEQRQKFLQQQEQDLVKSKEQLIDAIRKINETTKVMFAETFHLIQANFSQVFVDLFGGGRASLTLTDESDPLESGIEVIAKPPGKQLQNITLLSGGEKTMTAVALLFSIYMVKPSPFCVLDEMDAPLDESNIGRFIHMLQKFVKQSQFVTITHNKKTIAAADILYGVTMQEQGVSKIVSVKLTRKEEDPLFAQSSTGKPLVPPPSLEENSQPEPVAEESPREEISQESEAKTEGGDDHGEATPA